MTTIATGWKKLREPSAPVTVDPQGALAALQAARLALAAERARSKDTAKVSKSLKDLRTRNGFGDLIAETMRKEK